jgi:glycosyltransferase involved in cell wall biosynthesis
MSVGYVLKVFPRLSQTFVLGEVLAHQDAGRPVQIFSLRRPSAELRHRSLDRLEASPEYLDLPREKPVSEETLHAHAIRLAERAAAGGVRHLHAHFGNVAAEIARRAARLGDITYSFTAHARDIFHESVCAADLRRKLDEADFVVTVSDYNQRYLVRTFGLPLSKVARIYNGVDLDRYTIETSQRDPMRLLAVGRLVAKKGFADLVDACRLLRDRGTSFHCRLVGDGPLLGDLRRRVDEANLAGHVRFLGALPSEHVADEMRRASLLVAPCVEVGDGDRDGLPTVLPEAMALGLPCVSTGVTGIPEIVRDGSTGVLAPQFDPQALAEACRRLMADEALRERLAAAGRRLVEERFDLRVNTRRLRSLFRRSVESRSLAS